MLQFLLPLLSNVLPDVIKRVLPPEKLSEEDAAKLQLEMQAALAQQDWQKIEAEYKDRDSARNLAAAEIAKSPEWAAALAAMVRPAWGFGALALVAYSVTGNIVIGPALQSIVEMVLTFYFGGRVIEKIAPTVAGVLKK